MRISVIALSLAWGMAGCSRNTAVPPPADAKQFAQDVFTVDPTTAGTISGAIRYVGPKPALRRIDMSEDPACVKAHGGKAYDESIVIGAKSGLGNAFVYIKSGLEGKKFAIPPTPVTIDQKGCWFRPRVMGVQAGQSFDVTNSDPVTHNIHPMALVNREWNHSQGPGDAPMRRKFAQPEVMIPVKCNIHSWMRAYVGVLDHPYFTISKDDGSFVIGNLPPGTYMVGVWQEKLGTQEQTVKVASSKSSSAQFTFKGK